MYRICSKLISSSKNDFVLVCEKLVNIQIKLFTKKLNAIVRKIIVKIIRINITNFLLSLYFLRI